jgi:murein DD-endopeptidase MepM/ murein hydrolase activator NlpD
MARRLIRVGLVALAVLAAALVLRPELHRLAFMIELAADAPPGHLLPPVTPRGRHVFVNTWGAARGGGRHHEGIDIFAPKDTPVVSTTRGVVTRVGTNTLGGQVVWVLGPGLESHYYAHLDRFANVHPGDIVNAGDVLGYVGRTGNARTTPFHLHYGIYRFGHAENPYPRLSGG